jgi:hypothetical protein
MHHGEDGKTRPPFRAFTEKKMKIRTNSKTVLGDLDQGSKSLSTTARYSRPPEAPTRVLC